MFDADDVSAFNAEVVSASTAAHPTAITFRGVGVVVKCTAIKTAERLEDGGFAGMYDATARLSVANLALFPADRNQPPKEGEKLTHVATGLVLRIEHVDMPGAMPEYVLHLMKA